MKSGEHYRMFLLQAPTQNLPEILQQHSFSVQYFPLPHSSVFSLFTLSSPLWPRCLLLLVLWMSRDALTSLSPPTVWRKSVRSTYEQEVITGLGEGISRRGQTGRGPLTGLGEAWSLYRKE